MLKVSSSVSIKNWYPVHGSPHAVFFFLKLTIFGPEIFGEIVVQPVRLGSSAHGALCSHAKVQGTESRSPMVNYGALAPSLTLDRRFDPSAFDT